MKNPKTECFAWSMNGCRVIDGETDCANCSTYKTWDECYLQQLKCQKRLQAICKKFEFEFSIPEEKLKELRCKYGTNKTKET